MVLPVSETAVNVMFICFCDDVLSVVYISCSSLFQTDLASTACTIRPEQRVGRVQDQLEVVVISGAIRLAKLQSNRHRQHTNIQFIRGRMPFCCPTNSLKALKGMNV